MIAPYDAMMADQSEDGARVRRLLSEQLDQNERNGFDYVWEYIARREQLPPEGDWRIWMIMAGRGFGKTRSGAEWVRMIADSNPEARIALVSSSLAEARAVMVEGESGLLAICRPGHKPHFEPSLHRIRFRSGAQAQLFSASEPESLRGPQHSHAWCDEIGKWPLAHERATRCWDNLLLGLRLGCDPRIAVTTTPRAVPLVQRLVAQAAAGNDVAITRGSTVDNTEHLAERFMEAIASEFGDTQLARQEIGGELLEDIEGALWTRSLLEQAREHGSVPDQARVVVAVDPPAGTAGDECGIIVAALGSDGIARVLADCSLNGAAPADWAQTVANAAQEWDADRVVAEANQGGAMVESVLRAADKALPVKLVHASRGKIARAEPVAALYTAGRVRHVGVFARLEDQLCGLLVGGTYAGPGRSPDRADALVWALTELLLGRRPASPSVRQI
ncbi:DNA-packaging protein [Erythrobacter dokdonensis]|uniref:Phage DNA Packaging Protein n=1 Tax=Erythrobacter dokdonensis DSW-74 TaxID=1300349 RepID=A0A1A7BDV9_9SPHN|nr:terminase family protein [Erythrobacter dokdonensis]OBV09941.1 Phage DNA Packaging Protein [Erythrobacter dokdonensis DSW-74]